MRSFKPMFGLLGAIVPLVFVLGFLIYFGGVERFTGVPVGNALGPTMLGLGAVAILFAIPLLLRLLKLFAGARPAAPSSDHGGEPSAETPSDFDADAALARYLASRSAAGSPVEAQSDIPPRPPAAFGRKRV